MKKNGVVSVVRDFICIVVKEKQWSERSQRFTFNICELKQRSERSQRFHFDGSEVRQHSECSQRFYF